MSAITKERIPAGRLAVILGALATFGPFGTDMYLSGFPAMAQDLGSDVAGVQMSLSFYFIGLAIGQVIYGPLVDRVGRRVPLVCGLALFVVASACISFADSLGSLLFLRVLQALGGCSGMIVGRAVVRDLFDVRESAGILSMLAVVQGLGPIVAPVLGSQILTYASWRLVFVFLTLFGLGCLAAAYFGLPETLPPSRRRSGGAGEVLRDYGRLLVHRPFIVPALSSAIVGSCLFAYICGSPFVFMDIHGLSARQYGGLFASIGFGTILSAQLNRLLLRRMEPQAILGRAMVFSIAMVVALLALADWAPMWLFVVPLWLCIASLPLVFANSIAVAMGESMGMAGSASALVGLLQFAFAAVASSLVGLLHDGSAHPMLAVMLGGAVVGAAVNVLGRRREA